MLRRRPLPITIMKPWSSFLAIAVLAGAICPQAAQAAKKKSDNGPQYIKVIKPAKSKLPPEEQKKVDTSKMAPVPAALANLRYITKAHPNAKAKVFFIYKSHSACGVCFFEAPEIVEVYDKMKGKGAEVVMLNGDSSEQAALDWAESQEMKFPVVSPKADKSGVPFPYDGGALLPYMVVLDAQGNKIGQANGKEVAETMGKWKSFLKTAKKNEKAALAAKKAAAAEASSDSSDAPSPADEQ